MRSPVLLAFALLAVGAPAVADAGPVFRGRAAIIPATSTAVEQPIVSGTDTLLPVVPGTDGRYTLRAGVRYRTTRPIADVESDLKALANGKPFVFLTIKGQRYAFGPTRYGLATALSAAAPDSSREISEESGWLYIVGRTSPVFFTVAADEKETWRILGLREVK